VLTFDPPPADSAQPMLAAAMESFRYFLPRVPAGALRVGAAWADTVRQPFSSQGITGTSTLVVASRVVGDTAIGGRPAWRVARTGEVTMSGTGMQRETELALEGTGRLTGESWLDGRGIYLGAEESQTMDMRVEAPKLRLTIPISQRITSRTSLVSP
jgi:hypothetical protein